MERLTPRVLHLERLPDTLEEKSEVLGIAPVGYMDDWLAETRADRAHDIDAVILVVDVNKVGL